MLYAASASWGFTTAADRQRIEEFLGDRLKKWFALSYLSCPVLSACSAGVLWPNGWMDQDETSHGGRPRPGHIVLDGDLASPHQRGTAPSFLPISIVAKGRQCQLLLSTCYVVVWVLVIVARTNRRLPIWSKIYSVYQAERHLSLQHVCRDAAFVSEWRQLILL